MAESQTAGKTLFPGKGQVTSESTSAVYEERKRHTEIRTEGNEICWESRKKRDKKAGACPLWQFSTSWFCIFVGV